MSRIISHPFRVGRTGEVVTVEQDSDDGLAEQIAVTALTRRGERELVPDFGIDDPAFAAFDAGDLINALSVFGPPVVIEDVKVEWVNEATQRVELVYGKP